MDDLRSPLAGEIEAFLDRHALSPITFGRATLNDPHFVKQLKRGRRVWPETEAKVRSYMAGYGRDVEQCSGAA